MCFINWLRQKRRRVGALLAAAESPARIVRRNIADPGG
jgi:hypothetical protein